ncbi:hypothetical protein A6V39_03435 [Candidatus Mycoplasma haematobovis]|uniref:Uncharacterized protein n=1 Tax=Candidatus Mycoplasma haematobovis TaxID=432608 RepID=A0A1A9QCH2_9MOLU|nr:hypothetical protein [Candidatus Mycoplasma haematobovis]OAL09938.1 hypothetical protein A6V39_03435 [Candidatus Mycoplasma haematobovis]
MTDWLIKTLRTSAVITGFGAIGGIFYLTNNNERQTISTLSTREKNDTLIEIEDLQDTSKSTVNRKPILQACKKKWESTDWKPENDKLCRGIYIAKDEREQFYLTL